MIAAARLSTAQRAVKLIDPQPNQQRDCEDAVTRVLEEMVRERKTIHWVFPSKAKRRDAKRLHTVLKRLHAVLRDVDLDADVALLSPDAVADWLKLAEAAQSERGKSIRLNARMKKVACAQAIRLLEQFGKEISAAKKSTYCELAALLYGRKVDLLRQCQSVLRDRKQADKKLVQS